jgi:anti-anti-sigma factor
VAIQDQLQIDVRDEVDRTVVRLVGELDLASAPLLQSTLDGDELLAAPMVVLDLDELQFLDSTGLRVLLSAHERSREKGQGFAITRGTPQVQRLLSITRVDEHLPTIA